MARGIVLLEDKCLPLTIKRCCRGKHVISEHSDVLILSHMSFAAVDLADSKSGGLWAVSLPYSPPHKSLLCPTEQLNGAFIGPEHLLPLVQGPVIVLANLNRAFTVCGRNRVFFAASLAVLLPAVVCGRSVLQG